MWVHLEGPVNNVKIRIGADIVNENKVLRDGKEATKQSTGNLESYPVKSGGASHKFKQFCFPINAEDEQEASRDPNLERHKDRSNLSQHHMSKFFGVYGLLKSTTEKDLEVIILKYGRLGKVEVMKDKLTNCSLEFAFVYFHQADNARTAQEALVNLEIDIGSFTNYVYKAR